MVTFLTITLGISIAGMAGLLLLRRYELSSGHVFLGGARPRVGAFFHRWLNWFEHILPGLARLIARRLYLLSRHIARFWWARASLVVERGLEQALHRVRSTRTPPRPSADSSAFLREVAEHKKKLQEESPERNTPQE